MLFFVKYSVPVKDVKYNVVPVYIFTDLLCPCRCSRFETEIRRLRILKPVRVCQACYNILKAQQASEALARSTSAKAGAGSVKA